MAAIKISNRAKKKKYKTTVIPTSSFINSRVVEEVKKYPIAAKYSVKPITPSDLAFNNNY